MHGRDGGAEGVGYWTLLLDTGTDRFEVARVFLASPENVERVMERAHQLTLGRSAAAEEQAFWAPQLFISSTYEEMVETLLTTEALWVRHRDLRLALEDDALDLCCGLLAEWRGRRHSASRTIFERISPDGTRLALHRRPNLRVT